MKPIRRSMMKISNSLISFLLSASLAFWATACIKEQDIFQPDAIEETDPTAFKSPLSDFYEVQGIAFQEFTLDPTQNQILESTGKLQIHFPAGSLLDEEGSAVSTPVKIQILEAQSKGELILFNIASAAQHSPHALESAFFIAASSGGKVLTIHPERTLEVNLPYPGTELTLLNGEWPNQRYFQWAETATTVSNRSYTLANNEVTEGVSAKVGSFFWKALGSLPAFSGPVTDLCVRTPAGYDAQNTSVFIVFDNYPIVLELPREALDDGYAFCQPGLPAGANAQLILISRQAPGSYHFDRRSVTISGVTQTEVLEPAPKTTEDIREILEAL